MVSKNSVYSLVYEIPISSLVCTRQARTQCAEFAQTEKNYRSTKSKESFSCMSWKHFEWRNPASRVGVCGITRWRSRSDHLGTIRLMYISALKGKSHVSLKRVLKMTNATVNSICSGSVFTVWGNLRF